MASSSSDTPSLQTWVTGIYGGGVIVSFLLVITGMVFLSRVLDKSTERFRVSLAFAILSIFFPPFAVVPICLNVKDV